MGAVPHRKVAVGALAGALVTVAIWVGHQVWSLDPPPEVAAALVVLVSAVASYLVPESDQV